MHERQSLLLDLDAAIRAGSHDRRTAALARITDLFVSNVAVYTESQIDLFDDVILRLVDNVRADDAALIRLSGRLAPVPRAPVAVIRILAANDNIEIAGPVLAQSQRLTNSDLIKVALCKSQKHLRAISCRDLLEEPLTDVLVERGDIVVLRELSGNIGASFSEVGYVHLAERSREDERLLELTAGRRDLPRNVLRMLVVRASRTICVRLLRTVREELREEVVAALGVPDGVPESATVQRARAYARALQQRGELNETALRMLADNGRHDEICAALELLTELNYARVARVMQSGMGQAVLTLCKAASLSWASAWAILESRRDQHGTVEFRREQLRRDYAQLSRPVARRIVGFWQARDADPASRGDIVA
jgi:uncharacterized protein (DUF2336 family)